MFVERDSSGKIKGAYWSAQAGYAEEELQNDNAELIAFLDGEKDYKFFRREAYSASGATIEALVVAMFENDAAEIDRLHKIRQEVKRQIVKDESAR